MSQCCNLLTGMSINDRFPLMATQKAKIIIIIVSVKSLRTKGNLRVKKKDVCLALIFQTKYRVSRVDKMFFKFKVNSVILLNKALKPYGTRFFGPLFKELRSKKKLKIILLGKDFF